jgi:hypothetical protein
MQQVSAAGFRSMSSDALCHRAQATKPRCAERPTCTLSPSSSCAMVLWTSCVSKSAEPAASCTVTTASPARRQLPSLEQGSPARGTLVVPAHWCFQPGRLLSWVGIDLIGMRDQGPTHA